MRRQLVALVAGGIILAVSACGSTSLTTGASTSHARSGPPASATQWLKDGGKAQILAIIADVTPATGSTPAPTCAKITSDIARAKAYGPIPDAQAQGAWTRALDDFTAACKQGNSLTALNTANQGYSELTAMGNYLPAIK